MSKTKQAEELFRSNPEISAKDVSSKVGITVAHAYNVRRRVIGPIYKSSKVRRVQKASKIEPLKKAPKIEMIIQQPKQEVGALERQVESLSNSNILLQAQLNEALRELEDFRAVVRYLEKKINADAV